MQRRPDINMARTFLDTCHVLDAGVRVARATLFAQGVRLEDHCNRSGWGPSDDPYYLWAIKLERRSSDQNEVNRVDVIWLRYREPAEVDITSDLEIEISAKRFYTGKEAHFQRTETEQLPLEIVLKRSVPAVIRDCLAQARQMQRDAEAGRTV